MAPSPITKCSKCNHIIQGKEFVVCHTCGQKYDIQCAKVPAKRFHLMDKDKKCTWKCTQCLSKRPVNNKTILRDETSTSPRCPSPPDNDSFTDTNVTQRKNQNISTDMEEITYVTETRLRDILQQELNTALKSTFKELITSELRHIVGQIQEFRESMEYFNKQYEDLKSSLVETHSSITSLRKENDHLKSTVNDLNSRLHLVEQHMRQNNVEINGIPEHKSENLIIIVEHLTKTVDCKISAENISHVSRVAKFNKESPHPRSVVVTLRTPRQRDEVLAAVVKFNKANPREKLSTHHLGIGGSRMPVFVSEHLTPSNKALHAAARIKAKEMAYKFVWVRNGRIYVRKNESSQALLVRNTNSLNLIS